MDLAFVILFGAGLFLLGAVCYVGEASLKSKKICFFCGPWVILYFLALIIILSLYIALLGFNKTPPTVWILAVIEFPFYLWSSFCVISGFREFLLKPKPKEAKKEEIPVIDVLNAEKPVKEEKKEEPKMEEKIKFDNEKPKKEIPPYVFEFSTCAEDDQFLIRLKFTNNIPMNEDPAIYYRRMTDVIATTILKDAILNNYRVKIENRNDYNPKIPLFPPFYKFRLSNATKDKFENLKAMLLCEEFIEKRFFQVVANNQNYTEFHNHPMIVFLDEGFVVDGFFIKDDKSINHIGYDLVNITKTMMYLIDFLFSFTFYFSQEDSVYDRCHYLHLNMSFKCKDIFMADVAALVFENISLDELMRHHDLNLVL